MKKHKIGWLNVPGFIPQTWNPIVGCSKVSEGCRNCYAERMAGRLVGMGVSEYGRVVNIDTRTLPTTRCWNGKTFLVEAALPKPLGWKKPRAIFVNSMGDLFHENTPDEWIDQVHYTMAKCPQHLFIVLTKRAERMAKYYSEERCLYETDCGDYTPKASWPLPNVWIGVTAENQEAADARIPHLLSTPAAVRFVSCEPLIGPVDLCIPQGCRSCNHPGNVIERSGCRRCGGSGREPSIDLIIAGGESGANQEVRPGHAEWFRSIRDQADEAGIPFFFKQWGNPAAYAFSGFKRQCEAGLDKVQRNGGDSLDGRQWRLWPEVKKRKS